MATVVHLCQLLAGCVYYPSIYFSLLNFIEHFWKHKLSAADIYEISLRCVSSIQALVTCVVGVIIISSCQDIMHDQIWLTNNYARFMLPYFYYDTWSMYRVHWYRFPLVQTMSRRKRIKHFLTTNALMMVHHVILPLVFYPIVLFLRKGIGDFFVGVFYLFEMAIPFISARFIMVQLNLKDTGMYIVVGLMMIGAFFISRILIFPYLYWCYGNYRGIPLMQVPSVIPIKCNVSCVAVLLLQCYWLCLMVRGAYRVFYKIYQRRKQTDLAVGKLK